DYYEVAGGFKSMYRWRVNHLAKRDGVHLTYAGYKVKGDLFYNALLNSYLNYNNAAVVQTVKKKAVVNDEEEEPDEEQPTKKVATRHVVKSGETLYGIAKKYNISIEDLQRMNGLNSSYIRPNMVLIIKMDDNGKPI